MYHAVDLDFKILVYRCFHRVCPNVYCIQGRALVVCSDNTNHFWSTSTNNVSIELKWGKHENLCYRIHLMTIQSNFKWIHNSWIKSALNFRTIFTRIWVGNNSVWSVNSKHQIYLSNDASELMAVMYNTLLQVIKKVNVSGL